MKSFRVLLLLLPVLLMSNQCEQEEDENNDEFACSYSITQTLDLSSDVTTNFTENNVQGDAVLTAADCPGLTVGGTSTATADSVTRSGNTITVVETIDGEEETTTLQLIGTDIVSQSSSFEFEGCEISATVTGRINTTANDIIVVIDGSFRGDPCEELANSTLTLDSAFNEQITPLMNYFR